MSYIKEIALKNYRSFVDARCRLSPFTLIVGANNAGKSNLLKAVQDVSESAGGFNWDELYDERWRSVRHHAAKKGEAVVELIWSDGAKTSSSDAAKDIISARLQKQKNEGSIKVPFSITSLDPQKIGRPEPKSTAPSIGVDGTGVSATLDQWNSGAKVSRDRFARVSSDLRRCIPEIEALSFYDVVNGSRGIQVEQSRIPKAVPLSEVSEGTRIVLAILTLLNLETPPPVMLIEDIDRGLHPRLYEKLVEFLRTVTKNGRTQILATTHDPYLIDEFYEMPEAVVIVDKENGESTLSNLDDRIEKLRSIGADVAMPLGALWFSGSVGGVAGANLPQILKTHTA